MRNTQDLAIEISRILTRLEDLKVIRCGRCKRKITWKDCWLYPVGESFQIVCLDCFVDKLLSEQKEQEIYS